MSIFFRALTTFTCLCVLFVNTNVIAQNDKDKALLSLLDSLPNGSAIDVYAVNSGVKISTVSLTNERVVTENFDRKGWSKTRFQSELVPVWVSDQFIQIDNGMAKVIASNLNARIQPSVQSEKITSFAYGHTGEILSSKGGFIQLYAPVETAFLVKDSDLVSLPEGQVTKVTHAISPHQPFYDQVASKKPQGQSPIQRTLVTESIDYKELNTQESHKIAPGDSISLLVFGEPDLSRENIRVPENGRVSLPLIGEVAVADKTTQQVENQVRDILASGYVKNPRLSVSIFSYRPIFIRGAVQNTGAFPYSEGLSIAKALAVSGGSLNSAKPDGVSVLRDGVVVESGLSLDSQYQVSSGDVITVEEELGVRADENLFIYLHGEVSSPGEYRYRKGLTVEKAIVLSGGFTIRASRKKISITRYSDVDENQKPTTLKRVKLYTTIMPGDVINVRASLF